MYYSEFGENLKKLRTARDLTQQELGAKVGLSKAVVSKYENGLGYPTFDVLIRIAAYFGVTTDYLLGVTGGKTIDVSELSDSQIDMLDGFLPVLFCCNLQHNATPIVTPFAVEFRRIVLV